jgi:hypothetical protein
LYEVSSGANDLAVLIEQLNLCTTSILGKINFRHRIYNPDSVSEEHRPNEADPIVSDRI